MKEKDKQIARIEGSHFKTQRATTKEITMLRDRLSSSDRGCAQAYGSMEYEIAVAVREAKRESDLECSKQVEKLKCRLQREITQREMNDLFAYFILFRISIV